MVEIKSSDPRCPSTASQTARGISSLKFHLKYEMLTDGKLKLTIILFVIHGIVLYWINSDNKFAYIENPVLSSQQQNSNW